MEGVAAYMYVVPNERLSSGQRAKHLQYLEEAVTRDDLHHSQCHRSNIQIAHVTTEGRGAPDCSLAMAVVGLKPAAHLPATQRVQPKASLSTENMDS